MIKINNHIKIQWLIILQKIKKRKKTKILINKIKTLNKKYTIIKKTFKINFKS